MCCVITLIGSCVILQHMKTTQNKTRMNSYDAGFFNDAATELESIILEMVD